MFKDTPEGSTHHDNDECRKCKKCRGHFLSDWINDHVCYPAVDYVRTETEKARNEVTEKMDHEIKKFTDGFNHPKDCNMCKTK